MLALPLRLRATRPLDVGAGAAMPALQKRHARPDGDRLFVLSGEIMIESREEQLLDTRLSLGISRRAGAGWVDWQRLRHQQEVADATW